MPEDYSQTQGCCSFLLMPNIVEFDITLSYFSVFKSLWRPSGFRGPTSKK